MLCNSVSNEWQAKDSQDEIVKAIISLGKNLNLKVVAEGIETQEQLELLRQHQCSVGQGYLLGKPQSPSELEILLQAGHILLSNREPVV